MMSYRCEWPVWSVEENDYLDQRVEVRFEASYTDPEVTHYGLCIEVEGIYTEDGLEVSCSANELAMLTDEIHRDYRRICSDNYDGP